MARKPDRVKAAKLKLARAAKHLKAIKRCISKYAANNPYRFTASKTNGKKTKHLMISKEPPVEISILSREMIYQMRSALDHLTFGLVERNVGGIALPSQWEKKCQFPLVVKRPTHGKPPVSYNLPCPYGVLSGLPGISQAAFAFIESLQPYYGAGTTSANTALRFLGELSNIDKHRYLNVVAGRVRESHAIRYASGKSSSGYRSLDHGAKIEPLARWDQSDRAVYVKRRFEAFVHFKERQAIGDAVSLPLDYLLEFVLKDLEAIVVPALDKFINKP